MGNYLSKNERFHLFSKSPIAPRMSLGQAVNRAGHTVTASDVWTSDIPWFTQVASTSVALTRCKNSVVNDHINLISGTTVKIYKRNSTPQTDSSIFEDLWVFVGNELPDKYEFYPRGVVDTETTKPVIIYHKDVNITTLTATNNIVGSQNTAGRIWITDETGATHAIEQFVTATDKIIDGQPSNGYSVTVKYNGNIISENSDDDATTGYVSNAFAGIIYYNNPSLYSNKCTANVFEYVGEKLEYTIADFESRISELEENGGGSSISEDQVKELAEEVVTEKTLTGSIADETTDNLVTDTQVKDYVTTKIGEIPATDLSDYYTKEQVDDALALKADESTVDSKISTAITEALNEGGSIKEELDKKADTSALVNLASKEDVTNAITSALGEDGAISGAIDDVKTELSDKIEGIDVGVTSVTGDESNANVQVAATTADGAVTLKVTTSDIASAEALSEHTGNTEIHVTANDKTKWNDVTNKASQSDLDALDTRVTTAEENIAKKINAEDIITYVQGNNITIITDEENDNTKIISAVIPQTPTATNETEGIVKISDNDAITTTEITVTDEVATVAAVANTVKVLEDKIDAIKGFSIEKVTGFELPEPSADCVGKIYLVSKITDETTDETDDIYEEYICVKSGDDYSWELIGSTEISLEGYVTDGELTSALDEAKGYADSKISELPQITTYKIVSEVINGDEPTYVGTDGTPQECVKDTVYVATKDGTTTEWYCYEESGTIKVVQLGTAGGGSSVTTVEIKTKNADDLYASDVLSTEQSSGNGTVTIVANPAKDWSYEDLTEEQIKQFANVVTVENGMMFGANNEYIATIDARNLSSGMSSSATYQGIFANSQNLVAFAADMPKLTDGSNMFSGCANLVSFCADLSSLRNAEGMFQGCSSLSTASIEMICDALPVYDDNEDHIITIVTGNSDNSISGYINKTAKATGWTIIYNGTEYPLAESTETE